MVFYLIGIGLDENQISKEGFEIIKKADEVYLENYTVDFPYSLRDLEKSLGIKITPLNREDVENESILKQADKKDIVLLVFGSPLTATTHISLILSCIKQKIEYKIIHNASIFDAIAETGLQLYKFGKTASMPTWNDNFKPKSFVDIINQNQSIQAHTLLLIDIGLDFQSALKQFQESIKGELEIEKIIICSQLGKNSKIYYESLSNLSNIKIKQPFCFIIPSKLHFLEKEFLEAIKKL